MDTEGQHHFDPVVVGCECDVVAGVVVVVLSICGAPKKEGKSTVVGGISAKYVTGTAYIRSRHKYDFF